MDYEFIHIFFCCYHIFKLNLHSLSKGKFCSFCELLREKNDLNINVCFLVERRHKCDLEIGCFG